MTAKTNNFEKPVDISTLSDKALDIEIDKGYKDINEGRTKDVNEVFSDIYKDYKIDFFNNKE